VNGLSGREGGQKAGKNKLKHSMVNKIGDNGYMLKRGQRTIYRASVKVVSFLFKRRVGGMQTRSNR